MATLCSLPASSHGGPTPHLPALETESFPATGVSMRSVWTRVSRFISDVVRTGVPDASSQAGDGNDMFVARGRISSTFAKTFDPAVDPHMNRVSERLLRIVSDATNGFLATVQGFNQTGRSVVEVCGAVSSLLATDNAITKDLDERYDATFFAGTDLQGAKIQAIAPGIDGRVKQMVRSIRERVFGGLGTDPAVSSGSPAEMITAISRSRQELATSYDDIAGLVTHAQIAANAVEQNEATREIFSEESSPSTEENPVAYMSGETFFEIKQWLLLQSRDSQDSLGVAFAQSNSRDEMKKWERSAQLFAERSEVLRNTIDAVAASLLPLSQLTASSIDERAAEVSRVFEEAKRAIERTAVALVTSDSSHDALAKLSELKELSQRVATGISDALAKVGDSVEYDSSGFLEQVESELKSIVSSR